VVEGVVGAATGVVVVGVSTGVLGVD